MILLASLAHPCALSWNRYGRVSRFFRKCQSIYFVFVESKLNRLLFTVNFHSNRNQIYFLISTFFHASSTHSEDTFFLDPFYVHVFNIAIHLGGRGSLENHRVSVLCENAERSLASNYRFEVKCHITPLVIFGQSLFVAVFAFPRFAAVIS